MNENDGICYVLLIELELEAKGLLVDNWCAQRILVYQSYSIMIIIIYHHISIYIYIFFKSIPEVIILHHWWKPICLGLANLPDGVSGERFGYLAHGRGPGGDSPFMKFMQCVKSWLINLGYASTRK